MSQHVKNHRGLSRRLVASAVAVVTRPFHRMYDKVCSVPVPEWDAPTEIIQKIYELPVPRWANFLAENKRYWARKRSLVGLGALAFSGMMALPAAGVTVNLPHNPPVTVAAHAALPRYRPALPADTATLDAEHQAIMEQAPSVPVIEGVQNIPDTKTLVADLAAYKAQQAAEQAAAAVTALINGPLAVCIRTAEEGGSYAWGPGNGGGAYQFEPGTWAKYAPAGAVYGHANQAQQDQAYANALAAGDVSAWDADGCPQRFGVDGQVITVSAQVNSTPASGSYSSLDAAAYNWALGQAGKPYIWGGTGPGGFDCSGLVYAAYLAQGVTIPRDTYEMLASVGVHLVPISNPQTGDLAFFGTGHVEFYVNAHTVFGAQQPGTDVGYQTDYPGSWYPTAYYAVVR
jgi:cell wall-associated NlpC family hydrolase